MALLELSDIGRYYGSLRALHGVNLRLEPGTIGLIGNNGAGKSTLLKILLGLLAPDSGGGSILGCDIRRANRELRGRVGYMPESSPLISSLKGVEYVALSGSLYGMSRRDARRRAHEVLNYVGLGELRYRKLEEYSTGNVQRLKLAGALVHDPELLLLDEPTNGLDPSGRNSMLNLLQDLIKESGKSVILCTHLLGDVEKLCRQVVVLHQGQVLGSGTLRELRAVVGNRFEISCMGEAGVVKRFFASLQEAGGEVHAAERSQRMIVAVPESWKPLRFFEVAKETGAVVTHLKPDEEDLEELFFRVTSAGKTGIASKRVT